MHRGFGALGAIVLCVLLVACARPVGDFGRAHPSFVHDEAVPAVGRLRAHAGGEPVSSLNLTDDEREMRDRVWRFLVAPHANDWFMDTAVELQRTRLIAEVDASFDPGAYYAWLGTTRYESSRVRYATLATHAQQDTDLAPKTFEAVCRVQEIDRRRAEASVALGGLSAEQAHLRHLENEQRIAWFTRAMRYRYDSYSDALDHLLVETPHEEARHANAALAAMLPWVDRAERGAFCDGSALRLAPARSGEIRPRVNRSAEGTGRYLK